MKPGPLFLVAGVVLLAVLFVLFKPQSQTPSGILPPVPAVAMTAPKVFELTVKRGKLASGPEVLAVREGDEVVLRVTSDRADEMHLHGYDLEMNLSANVPAELKFTASRSGRFEYELHKSHADLGALEVQPK